MRLLAALLGIAVVLATSQAVALRETTEVQKWTDQLSHHIPAWETHCLNELLRHEKGWMRNCFEFLGSMQMIRRLLLFAGIVKVTSRRLAPSQAYGQRRALNLGVPVRGKKRVVIVIFGMIIVD